ncbi:MAG: acetate/propionate family kinase [Planctomycetaceae bacterium]|nr:acetate/propionate family kinase [Planctomycetaceae bacterium]
MKLFIQFYRITIQETDVKILIANLGSTSFKYSLFEMDNEAVLARGRVERIGDSLSPCTIDIGGKRYETTVPVADHAVAVRQCLAQLTDPQSGCIRDAAEVAAIGFKAVHAAGVSGVHIVTAEVIDAMAELNDVMPAHNPPYVNAMRLLNEKLPEIPLVAAFETGFHLTIPERNRYYGVPFEWIDEHYIQRWGFHGASHRYIAGRTAQLLKRGDLRIVSCHLGGSSSLCAINKGESVAASMGTSSQTGLFQNNRVGDFDPFVLPYLMKRLNKSLDEILNIMSTQSGLLGLSGRSGDFRDLLQGIEEGDARSRLAVNVFVGYVRQYLGSYLVELGGIDVIVFTGGIGENNPVLREMVCINLDELGIKLSPHANDAARGNEAPIHAEDSKTQIWVVPTNEEIIVARQTVEALK